MRRPDVLVAERPGDDVCGLDTSLAKAGCNAADFLDRPADQCRCCALRAASFLGGAKGGRWRDGE